MKRSLIVLDRKYTPAAVEALEAIYAELPRLECKRLCQKFCGPIESSKIEWKRMQAAFGVKVPEVRADHSCPLLDRRRGLCMVYDVRPLLCRLFGLVERMRCPHGCVPERWLTDEESAQLFDRVRQVSGDTLGRYYGPGAAVLTQAMMMMANDKLSEEVMGR